MTPIALYTRLSQSQVSSAWDSFDAHVLASIFAITAAEFDSGGSLAEGLGISGKELRGIIATYFPGAANMLESFGLDREFTIADDEQSLRRLLLRSRTTAAPISSVFAVLIARRATRPNHLWQDLGLVNRGELSALMLRHFAPLALRNQGDMKWKKFFYRIICRDENSRMCVAPCCSECSDFEVCFGDESGESLLAQVRLHLEASGLVPVDSIVAG
jgi:nitrogen fixation protein NifQ